MFIYVLNSNFEGEHMKKRKSIILTLMLAFVLCLASCSGADQKSDESLSDVILEKEIQEDQQNEEDEEKLGKNLNNDMKDPVVEEQKEPEEGPLDKVDEEVEDPLITMPESYYTPYVASGASIAPTITLEQTSDGLFKNPIGFRISPEKIEESLDLVTEYRLKGKDLYKELFHEYNWYYQPDNKVSFQKAKRISYFDKSRYSYVSENAAADMSMYMFWNYSISNDIIGCSVDFFDLDSVMSGKDMAKDALIWNINKEYINYLLEGEGELVERVEGSMVENDLYQKVPTNVEGYSLLFRRDAKYPVAPADIELFPDYYLGVALNYDDLTYVEPKDTIPQFETSLKENHSKLDLSTLMNGSFINNSKKYIQSFGKMANIDSNSKQMFLSNVSYKNFASEEYDLEELVFVVNSSKKQDDTYESQLKTEIYFSSTLDRTKFSIEGNFIVEECDNNMDAIKISIKKIVNLMTSLYGEEIYSERELVDTIKEYSGGITQTSIRKTITFLGQSETYSLIIKVEESKETGVYNVSLSVKE